MKKIHTIICYSFIVAFLIPSCTMQKRKYTNGYYTQWNRLHKRQSLKGADTSVVFSEAVVSNEIVNETDNASNTASIIEKAVPFLDSKKILIKNSSKDDKCDIIILKTGDEIQGKVTEITLTEIKYKKCTNLEGPTISIDKKDVFMIRYANGTKDIITIDDASAKKKKEDSEYAKPTPKNEEKTKKKTNGLGLAGFITSLVGLLIWAVVEVVAGIPLGIAAIVLSSIGLAQKIKHPDKYKKGAFEILGLVFGVICLLLSIIFLAILL